MLGPAITLITLPSEFPSSTEVKEVFAVDVGPVDNTGPEYSFTFIPVAGDHFLTPNSTIKFIVRDCTHIRINESGDEEEVEAVQFCVEAKGNFATARDTLLFFSGLGHHLEDLLWYDLTSDVFSHYGLEQLF